MTEPSLQPVHQCFYKIDIIIVVDIIVVIVLTYHAPCSPLSSSPA